MVIKSHHDTYAESARQLSKSNCDPPLFVDICLFSTQIETTNLSCFIPGNSVLLRQCDFRVDRNRTVIVLQV